jgi:hypothetical protein
MCKALVEISPASALMVGEPESILEARASMELTVKDIVVID